MSARKMLRSFYAFVALRWLRLTGALWILYLLHVGWSLWQVGIAEAAFHLVSFAAGVPTGVYADRIGRRRSLVIGLLIGVLAPPLEYLLAPRGVLPGSLTLGFSALGWCFIGGADQALLYDLSRRLPEGSQAFARLYGRMDAISLLSGAVAAPLGGWLALSLGWRYAYFGQSLLTALAILPVLLLPRTEHAGPGVTAATDAATSRPSLAEAWQVVRSSPGLLGLVLFGALLGIVATSNHLYGQSSLTQRGETVLVATAVIGVSSLLAAAASALAHRLDDRHHRRLVRWGTLALGVLIAAVGTTKGALAPLSFAGSNACEGGVNVLYAAELNRAVPDALRATIASAPEALFSLGMIALFPLEGWAMGRFGLSPVYLALGLGLALTTPLIAQKRLRRGPGGNAVTST